MNEFNIARTYSIKELTTIHRMFKFAEEASLQDFPCMNLDCIKCPFNTLKGECGGKSDVVIAKYGRHPDWRSIESIWEQEIIDSSTDIEESEEMDETLGIISISLDEQDAKVLSEYIRRTTETLAIPDEMWRVAVDFKRLIDASLKHGNKDGD